MSEKISFDDLQKLYFEHMDISETNFFASGSHGWTKEEFIEKLSSDQKMAIEYYNAIKPLIDKGLMFLN